MDDCIFCKIVKGELATEKELETGRFIVIKDINPKAPLHLLIVPKKHVEDIRGDDENLWTEAGEIAKDIAVKRNLSSFRLVHNAGDATEVKHMHIHFLGGVKSDREI